MWHVWVRDVYTGFWWGKLRERDDFGERGVDEMVILKRILGVVSTDLSQDRNKWRAVVNTVMNIRFT